VHIVINNQLGFTTAPEAARTSVYPTDVAKMVQAPIFHVNGDDPEACARAARLAFGFRQAFHKDVVIDMVCYRRHGHNEGDDPSYTQPLMYALIEAKRSVRKLYTESLVRRGDISLEEAEQALDDFSGRLQAALDETRAEAESDFGDRAGAPRLRGSRPVDPAGGDGCRRLGALPAGHRGPHRARRLRDPPQAGPPVRAAGQGGCRRRDRLGAG
jgi:2-oxoglutarate dehydrogenase complex dehydrogenase (E1) component-like enzyme